jgi:hypothetical protein
VGVYWYGEAKASVTCSDVPEVGAEICLGAETSFATRLPYAAGLFLVGRTECAGRGNYSMIASDAPEQVPRRGAGGLEWPGHFGQKYQRKYTRGGPYVKRASLVFRRGCRRTSAEMFRYAAY